MAVDVRVPPRQQYSSGAAWSHGTTAPWTDPTSELFLEIRDPDLPVQVLRPELGIQTLDLALRSDEGAAQARLALDMRWAILLGAAATAAVALQILIWERRAGRRRPSTIGRIALVVLALVLVGAAVYSAHLLGIFSIPLVVLAFVPVGATVRWLILATRESRQLAAEAFAASAPPVTRRIRLLRAASLPIFVLMVLAVVLLGLVVGTIVGPH
jgi:hypothetical protein